MAAKWQAEVSKLKAKEARTAAAAKVNERTSGEVTRAFAPRSFPERLATFAAHHLLPLSPQAKAAAAKWQAELVEKQAVLKNTQAICLASVKQVCNRRLDTASNRCLTR